MELKAGGGPGDLFISSYAVSSRKAGGPARHKPGGSVSSRPGGRPARPSLAAVSNQFLHSNTASLATSLVEDSLHYSHSDQQNQPTNDQPQSRPSFRQFHQFPPVLYQVWSPPSLSMERLSAARSTTELDSSVQYGGDSSAVQYSTELDTRLSGHHNTSHLTGGHNFMLDTAEVVLFSLQKLTFLTFLAGLDQTTVLLSPTPGPAPAPAYRPAPDYETAVLAR